jgi:dCTP deaminase
MILSDWTIKNYILNEKIKVIPAENERLEDILQNVACASFDLRLGNYFKVFPEKSVVPFDPLDKESREKLKLEEVYVPDWWKLILKPWQFVLGATKERIWLPDDIVARVEWRSSIARLWILVHITGWFIDPWFWWRSPSTITLEIKNVNTIPVVLRPWMRICQIAFEYLNAPAEVPYYKKKSAKYNWQIMPQESLIYTDPERNV